MQSAPHILHDNNLFRILSNMLIMTWEKMSVWYDGLSSSVFHLVVDIGDLPDDLKHSRELNS